MTDIVAEYRDNKFLEELRGTWVNVVVHRLPSFALVWIFARLGVSAMATSLLAGLVALSLPLLAYSVPLATAGLAVFLAGTLFQILDCTDGALARLCGTGSEMGRRVDFLIDMAQWGLLYLSLGILADRYLETHWHWAAVALAAAWVRLYARVFRDNSGVPQSESDDRPIETREIPFIAVSGLSGAIPFLALSGSWLGAAVIAVLIYAILDLADAALGLLSHRPG